MQRLPLPGIASPVKSGPALASVTLDERWAHLRDGDFVVIDKKTQGDITRPILLQVIAEQEHDGEPLMSRDFLSQVIRSYGDAMRSTVGSYLEQSLKLFASQNGGRGPPG